MSILLQLHRKHLTFALKDLDKAEHIKSVLEILHIPSTLLLKTKKGYQRLNDEKESGKRDNKKALPRDSKGNR